MLLDRGADVKATITSNGWTALHYAVRQGHEEVARVLLQHGSKVARKDESGRTPQLIACDDSIVPIPPLPQPGTDSEVKEDLGKVGENINASVSL